MIFLKILHLGNGVKPVESRPSFYGNLPLPTKSSTRKKGQNNNEIPTFANTARRTHSAMRHNQKRSITFIEEASV